MFTCEYRMSTTVRTMTVGVAALFVAIPIAAWTAVGWREALVVTLVMLLPATIFWFFWRETPVRLEIDEWTVRVVMRSGSERDIRLACVRSVRILCKDDLRWIIRMGGNGGVGGYTGLFWNRRLRYFTLYAASMDELMLLVTMDGKKYVFGCRGAAEAAEYLNIQLQNG